MLARPAWKANGVATGISILYRDANHHSQPAPNRYGGRKALTKERLTWPSQRERPLR